MAETQGAGRFAGQVGVVTGAASGLEPRDRHRPCAGGCAARSFDRDEAGLLQTAIDCEAAITVAGDVSSAADLDRVAEAASRLGTVSLLATAAGILRPDAPTGRGERGRVGPAL